MDRILVAGSLFAFWAVGSFFLYMMARLSFSSAILHAFAGIAIGCLLTSVVLFALRRDLAAFLFAGGPYLAVATLFALIFI